MSARSDRSFPFWQSNVAHIATFDCQNGKFWGFWGILSCRGDR